MTYTFNELDMDDVTVIDTTQVYSDNACFTPNVPYDSSITVRQTNDLSETDTYTIRVDV